jgi:hypothetical protein
MNFSDLPQPTQDRIEAAWLEAHRVMIRKGPARGPEAGVKHYLSAVAKELWAVVKPDVEVYTTRLKKLGTDVLEQFGELGTSGVHPAVVASLIMKWRAKALRERAARDETTGQTESRLSISKTDPVVATKSSSDRSIRSDTLLLVTGSKGNGEDLVAAASLRAAASDCSPRSRDRMISECPLLCSYSKDRLRQSSAASKGQLSERFELSERRVRELHSAIEQVKGDRGRKPVETALLQEALALRREIVGVAETVATDSVRVFGDELLLSQNQRLIPYKRLLREYTARLVGDLREMLNTSLVFQPMFLPPWRQDSIAQKAIQICEHMLAERRKIECEGLSDNREIEGSLDDRNEVEPRTWPAIVQEWEAVKSVRRIITGITVQDERIPESDFRALLSVQHGVEPENVSSEQIEHAALEMCPHYERFKIIPQTDLFAGPEATRYPTAIPDAVFWKEREGEFREHATARSAALGIRWFSGVDHWAFYDGAGASPLTESVDLFKSLAREAAKGLGGEGGPESWKDWLNMMRVATDEDTGRLLYAKISSGSSSVSEREFGLMIRAGEPIHAGVLIEYVEKSDATIERRRYWETSTVIIKHLFGNSASLCLRNRSLAPHPRLARPRKNVGTLEPAIQQWEDIECIVISDERVEIRIGAQRETRNYRELGFEDQRTEKPNEQWAILQALARQEGHFPHMARPGKEWAAVAKRIERTRKTLQKHFRIADDPIPYVDGGGYRTRFKIHRSSAADT